MHETCGRLAIMLLAGPILVACASVSAAGGLGKAGSLESGERVLEPPASDLEQLGDDWERSLQGAVVLPPDRGLLAVELRLMRRGRLAAAEQLVRARVAAIVKSVSSEAGCRASLADALAMRGLGADVGGAVALLVVEADLHGLGSALERWERINRCQVRLEEEVVPEPPDEERDQASVVSAHLGEWRVSVDAPQAALERLLAQRAERARVRGQGEERCRPTGQVLLVARRLSGVELALQLECAP